MITFADIVINAFICGGTEFSDEKLVVIFQGIIILCVALTMQWVDRKLTSRERRLGS